MDLSVADVVIVIAYLCFALGVGIASARRSSQSSVAFFAAGRSMPGWLLGISMVATTFAVDTPLAVTGIVAGQGIAGNWFWWCTAVGHVGVVVFLGRLWRRSEVLTDAELVELRYGGREAAVLRVVQAFFFAVVVNSFVLGWGLVAAVKVSEAVLPWNPWWTVGALVTFALVYAALGGLRAVILTDLAQFAFALVGSTALAVLAVREVGGLKSLVTKVQAVPGVPDGVLDLIPSGDAGAAVTTAFATYLLVQWWSRLHADGGGYLAQRMVAAKDPEQARSAIAWFVWLHYVVRPWPWILVALAALVIFPPGTADPLNGDRESAYPVLLMQLMPPGLLGIALASLLAAFMSTVDTHLNWGTSYLVNDLYSRFFRPSAGRREIVAASWIGMVLMAALAVAVASVFETIEGAWRALALGGAGLGLPTLLRWVWWRITAWCELAGMSVGFVTAAAVTVFAPDMAYAHKLWIVTACGATATALAILLGPRPRADAIRRFVAQVQPPGFWGPGAPPSRMGGLLLAWLLGAVSVYAVLMGLGKLLLGGPWAGLALLILGAACWVGSTALVRRADRIEKSEF
jgi:solute:Na+ symporter, SSS family